MSNKTTTESPPVRQQHSSTTTKLPVAPLPLPPPVLLMSTTATTPPPPPVLEAVRSTVERMPTLASAPNSGMNINITGTQTASTTQPSFGALPLPPPPPPPPPLIPPHSSTVVMDNPKFAAVSALPPPPPPKTTPKAVVEQVLEEPILIPPNRVDRTTFAATSNQTSAASVSLFLAKRQTQLPILLLASEQAQQMAWKNQLHLVDLFQGLVQDLSSVVNSLPLPPFRSVVSNSSNSTTNTTLSWNNMSIGFHDSMIQMSPSRAQELLQQYAQLLATDGNVMEELDLLEDQVDALICDYETTITRGANGTTNNNYPQQDYKSDMQKSLDRQAQLEQITKDAFALTSPPNIPWLRRFRAALDESTNWVEHDLIATPALALIVVSTQEVDDDILQVAKALYYSPHYLPDAYTNGTLDPASLRKEVLVLHDSVHGPTNFREDDILPQFKKAFGSGATILRINSILPTMAKTLELENTTDLWGGGGKRGNRLSHSDRLSIRRYMASIIASSLIPALERRISDLNHIVTEKKKGVRNVFKSLWRGAPPSNSTKELTSSTAAADSTTTLTANKMSKYRYDSVESQVRLLADTLFLIKDYDAALNMYKLIKDDYKHDRSLLHYAGIQEMLALCTLLLNERNNVKELFGYFETALFSYTRAAEEDRGIFPTAVATRPMTASVATRLATRLCLVMSAAKPTTMTVERHLEVADLLASASSNETSLGAAVLLEQSAAHYFKAGMYRKYAFHTLMAGHMFRSGSQEHHAFRCFTAALYIYHDGQWDELHNHLRSALAAQLYALGRMAASVELYAKLVGTTGGGRVSVKSQQKFVHHLLDICKDHPKKALVGADRMAAPTSKRKDRYERIERVIQYTKAASRILELPNMDLPYIEDSSVTMEVEVEMNRSGEFIPWLGTIAKGSESVWQELQCHTVAELKAAGLSKSQDDEGSSALAKIDDADIRRVISEIYKEKTNQNLAARAKRSGAYKETPVVRARMEPLAVQFNASNPLAILIELKDVQLVARLKERFGHRVCTNADAIDISNSTEDPQSWTFEHSTRPFHTPAFCRTSPPEGEEANGAWKSAKADDLFFVVTKVDLSIQPGSTLLVSLSICPLVQGDLEILGVRSKLFNDVWVFHPFKIKGALLHSTSGGISNRFRAEPMLLKAKVEQEMPRLSVNLISNRGPPQDMSHANSAVIQGQISSWTLQVSNRGSAPATNFTLKTNLPWIKVPTKKNTEEEATSGCVGPSGTLQLIHLPYEQIDPGESIEIPILIRTTGTALQDFYMLYRYAHADDVKKHRWLRQMISVPVYPSLQIKASLMPSYWTKDEHVLSVEVTNFKSGRMLLDKVAVASREYRVLPIDGQVENGADMMLDFQERVSMHYRLVTDSTISNTCMLSECPLSGTSSNSPSISQCIATDSVDYICLESANSRFRAAVRAHEIEQGSNGEDEDQQPRHVSQIRRAKTTLSDSENEELPSHPTSIGRIFSLEDSKSVISLMCFWKSVEDNSADIVCGQHHVTDLVVRPKTSCKGCPVTITCHHPISLSHDFNKGPAHIPFEVTVRNRQVEASVEFEFALERQKTLEFMGCECFTWELEGGDELTIPLQALISSPGLYNLQAVRLTVTKEGKKVPYLFPLQWMVTVISKSV